MADVNAAPADAGGGNANQNTNTEQPLASNDPAVFSGQNTANDGRNQLPADAGNKNGGDSELQSAISAEFAKPDVQQALSQMTLSEIKEYAGPEVAAAAMQAGYYSGFEPQQQIPPELLEYMQAVDQKGSRANEQLDRVKSALLGDEQQEQSPEEQLEAHIKGLVEAQMQEQMASASQEQQIAHLEGSYAQAAQEHGEDGANQMLEWAQQNGGVEAYMNSPDPFGSIGDAMVQGALAEVMSAAMNGNAEAMQIVNSLMSENQQQQSQPQFNDVSVGTAGRSGMQNVVDLDQRKEQMFNR